MPENKKRFYVDTSVWLDFLEDRADGIRPLGELAFQFFKKCVESECTIIYSELVVSELKEFKQSFEEAISNIGLRAVEAVISGKQKNEAKSVARHAGVSPNDALHSILARDNNAIVITRDRHFEELRTIAESRFPEQVIFDYS